MILRQSSWPLVTGVVFLTALYGFQRPFRVYTSMEPYDNIPLPPDWQEKTEWVFARLMYPQHPNARFGRYSRRYGGALDWREGGTSWTQDYPRADRHFALALRRLTRNSSPSRVISTPRPAKTASTERSMIKGNSSSSGR